MPTRRPLARLLLGIGLLGAGLVALVGGLWMGGPGLLATAVCGGVAAALAGGVAGESPGGSRATAVEAAWRAGAGTIAVILCIAGLTALTGPVVTGLLVAAGVIAAVAVAMPRFTRSARALPGARAASTVAPGGAGPVAAVSGRSLPVGGLNTAELGREWLRTTTLLAGRLEPSVRQSIIRRRQETLDELERRDAAGFARWMAGGAASDPAVYVHGERAAGSDAA